jgi:hypothetical protein
MRFSVGAVDVQSGNFTYFDNRRERIGPEHVMASGALPPGFGAVPIGEHFYWDGGLVSNTPLAYVMEQLPAGAARPVTVFQIDLFRARGRVPQTLADAAEREKDIRFPAAPGWSATRCARAISCTAAAPLAALLPKARRASAEVQALAGGHAGRARHPGARDPSAQGQRDPDQGLRVLPPVHDRALAGRRRRHGRRAAAAGPPGRRGEFRVLDHPDASMARHPPAVTSKETRHEQHDVRAQAWAMPLTSPIYPRGPYRRINREFMVISYRTDPALLAAVPAPLAPAPGAIVKMEFIRMPDSTGFGDYTESGR